MGQQQIILITLCVVIIGAAISMGLLMFNSSSIAASKDALIGDLNNLAGNAQAFYARPRTCGGGGNSFTGYKIPQKMLLNENGTFEATATNTTVRFKATALEDTENWMTAELDRSRPHLRFLVFNNEFDDE